MELKAAYSKDIYRTENLGQTYAYAVHHHAIAQFNMNMKLKDGAYMVEREIEAFKMYECLKKAR